MQELNVMQHFRFQIFGHSLWSNELQDQLGALLAYEYFTYQSGCGAAQLVPGRCANSLLRFSEPLSLEHTDRVDALLRALLARPAVSLSAVASAACLLMSKGEGGTAEDLVNRLACPAGAAPLVVSRAKELVAMARSSKSYALAHAAN